MKYKDQSGWRKSIFFNRRYKQKFVNYVLNTPLIWFSILLYLEKYVLPFDINIF